MQYVHFLYLRKIYLHEYIIHINVYTWIERDKYFMTLISYTILGIYTYLTPFFDSFCLLKTAPSLLLWPRGLAQQRFQDPAASGFFRGESPFVMTYKRILIGQKKKRKPTGFLVNRKKLQALFLFLFWGGWKYSRLTIAIMETAHKVG